MHADRAARIQQAEHLEIERLRVGLGQARLHPAGMHEWPIGCARSQLRELVTELELLGPERPDTQRFG